MEIIKFKLHRTLAGQLLWQSINFLVCPLPLTILIAEITLFNESRFASAIEGLPYFFVLFTLLPLPLILCCLFRDSVVVKGDKMIAKVGFWPKWYLTFNISTVSDIHYRKPKEGITFGNKEMFGIPFSKIGETVNFIDAKGNTISIATKDHEKLYALLKEREGPGYYDDWGRVSKWK